MNKIFLRLGFNTFIQGVGKSLSLLIGLFSISVLTRYLGVSEYGNYSLVFAYLSFFGAISDIGLNATVINELSKKESREKIVASYFWLKILTSLLSFLIPVFLLIFFPYNSFQKTAILIGAFAFGIGNFAGFGNTFLQIKLRLDIMTYIDLVGRIVTLAFTLIFVALKANLFLLIAAVLVGNISIVFLNYLSVRRDVSLNPIIEKVIILNLFRKSIPIGLASLLSVFYFKADTILLSVFKTSREVGIYSLSYKIFENVLTIWIFYVGSFYPLFSKYYNEGNNKKYTLILKNSVKIALVFAAVVLIIGLIFSPFVVKILGGNDFSESVLPLRILFLSCIFFFLNNIFYYYIFLKNRSDVLIKSLLFSLVLNMVLNVILIPKYSYIGTSVSTVITEGFLLLFYLFYLRS